MIKDDGDLMNQGILRLGNVVNLTEQMSLMNILQTWNQKQYGAVILKCVSSCQGMANSSADSSLVTSPGKADSRVPDEWTSLESWRRVQGRRLVAIVRVMEGG